MCFGHNHLSAFPRHTSLPYPPSFVTFKKINSNKTLQGSCAAKTFLEFCAGAAHQGCTASPLSSSQLLAGGIVSPVPLRYWDLVWLRLAVTNSEFSVQLLCCVQKTCFPHHHPPPLAPTLSPLLFLSDLRALALRGVCIHVSFRAEHSTVFYSLNLG